MFYARYHPRGFSNEFEVKAFATRNLRDQFVSAVPRTRYSRHYRAWVQQEPNARAYAINAREAAKLTYHNRKDERGNRLTLAEFFTGPDAEYYNRSVITDLDSDGYPPVSEPALTQTA
jgi:hypothetical protein